MCIRDSACIDHAFVNIREFNMPRQLTTTKTSLEEWTLIFSVSVVIIPTHLLCQMQANSSGAEFLSTISTFIKRKKILWLLVYVLHKTWDLAFSRGSRAVTAKKYTRKRDARAKLLFCHVKLLLFLLSRRHFIFKLPIIYDTFWSVRNNFLSANLIAPADSIRNVFRLIGSSLVSG